MYHIVQTFGMVKLWWITYYKILGKENVGEFAIALILKCLNVYCQKFDESVGESVTSITIYASNMSQILYLCRELLHQCRH